MLRGECKSSLVVRLTWQQRRMVDGAFMNLDIGLYVVRQPIPITCLEQERNSHPDYLLPRHSSTASFNSVMSSSVTPVISLTQIGGIVHVWSI